MSVSWVDTTLRTAYNDQTKWGSGSQSEVKMCKNRHEHMRRSDFPGVRANILV